MTEHKHLIKEDIIPFNFKGDNYWIETQGISIKRLKETISELQKEICSCNPKLMCDNCLAILKNMKQNLCTMPPK